MSAGIESLFNKINCDRSAIDDMLGATAGVTESNMLQYLGIIEQRTNELLAVQAYILAKVGLEGGRQTGRQTDRGREMWDRVRNKMNERKRVRRTGEAGRQTDRQTE